MTSTADRIRAASDKNTSLLRELTETEYAVPALHEQAELVRKLRQDLDGLDKRVQSLECKRKQELKDHERYQNSVVKRLAYKAAGQKDKFAAKAKKEEKDYFDALAEEQETKKARGELRQRVQEAETTRAGLEKVAKQHQRAQTELDSLYNSIFNGPTPEFPAEDAVERTVEKVLAEHKRARGRWEDADQARLLLEQATTKMRRVIDSVTDARSQSKNDILNGGAYGDVMERNALHKAEVGMMEINVLLMRAKSMDDQVGELPMVDFATDHAMSNILLDNIFTDKTFHDKIKAGQVEAERAEAALGRQRHFLVNRIAVYKEELEAQEEQLKQAREILQKTRERIFEYMTEQVPEYSE